MYARNGDRFAAAQPISMGLAKLHGSTATGVAERFNRTLKEQIIHGRI